MFYGKFLSLATGLAQVVNNLGLAASNFLTGKVWLSSRNMSVPFFWAALSCVVSVVASFVWAFIEIFGYDKLIEEKSSSSGNSKQGEEGTLIESASENVEIGTEEEEIVSHSHGGKIDFSMIKDMKDPLILLCLANLMLGA